MDVETLWVVSPAWDPWKLLMSLAIATLVFFMIFADDSPAGQVLVQLKLSRTDKSVLKRFVLPADYVKKVDTKKGKEEVAATSEKAAAKMRRVLRSTVSTIEHHLRPIFDTLALQPPSEDASNDHKLKPLLIFVNTKSGGKQGKALLAELRQTLEFHETQVVELPASGPGHALSWWARSKQAYRILVCGGDGTVGWVLNELDNLQPEYIPPVAVLPLGTGNDLARVIGWGSGFPGGSVMPVLRRLTSAHVLLLDRWAISCRDIEPAANPEKRGRKELAMCNYFGIGVDAAITLDFHEMRNWVPHLFVSRLVNKAWYARSGAANILFKTCRHISQKIVLECDGEVVDIPDNMEGVIVLNIPSYGGGVDLWGAQDDEVRDEGEPSDVDDDSSDDPEVPSMQDKKLEVVCVHSSFHLGAAQVGLYTAKRLRQASQVRIRTSADLPVQADGEPWRFAANGEIVLSHRNQALMLGHENESVHAVATELVEWAAQSKVIDMGQRAKMIKEISRRVQRSKHPSRDRLAHFKG